MIDAKEIKSQEIAIDVDNVDGPDSPLLKTKIDLKPHNGEKIDKIIVPQEFNSILDNNNEDVLYFITYSKEDRSICRWAAEDGRFFNIKNDLNDLILRQHDMYFKLDQNYDIKSFVLCKKMLLFYYSKYYVKRPGLIDLNGNEGRYQLMYSDIEVNSIGILPNGDLIITSLDSENCKIYKYSFTDKPTTNRHPWKYSQMYQIYDIGIPKSLKEHRVNSCFVYQTKLFLFDKYGFTQWNLLKMTFEMQYLLEDIDVHSPNIVINKSQTLLALGGKKLIIFSIKNGMQISDCDHDYNPVEFVILEGGHEGLIVNKYENENENENYKYKFLDPYLLSDDAMDITDVIENPFENIITKSNRKFSIAGENNVCVTNGLKEDIFHQMLNNTYHSNIYTLPIFKTIQNMLNNIIENDKICDIPDDGIKLSNKNKSFHFTIYQTQFSGFIESESYSQNTVYTGMIFSYEQLNNQDLALITSKGISIFTIVDKGEHDYFPRLKYFWNNENWNNSYEKFSRHEKNVNIFNDYYGNHYRLLIERILNNEFNNNSINSSSSLPSPNFTTIFKNFDNNYNLCLYGELILNIINNPVEFSNFGLKILKTVIDDDKKEGKKEDSIYKKENDIVQLIFKKIFESIKNNIWAEKDLLQFIVSSALPKLCNYHYSDLVIKYILRTSITLDPNCSSIKYSTNTSLYAYSKDCFIKESIPSRNRSLLSLSFYKNYLKIRQKTPVISFIVPFPKICKYQKGHNNSWNKMLHKPKSILFCNIDSKNFYEWWNFAAIIDFKWKIFGRTYYYLIWSFYTIFFLCFSLASTLDNITNFYRNILFIISILLGIIHLFFEIRQFLWKPRIYVNDIRNLFDIGAYFLPIITSLYWLFNGKPSLWITAMSNLLLDFKFLLFFRIYKSFGIYFAIMIGVAKKVFPFLVVLFFIIFGFAHAFFITLKSTKNFSLDDPTFDKNDENNPWNLATEFNSINSDGTISSNPTLIQHPDSNTNMFNWFPTSLLAMYLLLIGDSGSLSSWTYHESPLMSFLLVLFTFFTVIYLMNLFIGLLNMAIDDYNKNEEFLLEKALIIMEIELFYMLPYQRYKKEWFPDWIYYDIPINEVRKLINAIDNNQTKLNLPPFISKKLRELVEIPDPVDKLKRQTENIENKLKQQIEDIENKFNQQTKNTEDKLSNLEQQMRNMQELLKDFIKNSNTNN